MGNPLDKLKGLTGTIPPQTAAPYYPTGVPVLDTGCHGLPAGKAVHLVGEPGTGKTTVAVMAAAELVKAGWVTVYIDWTLGLTPDFLKFHDVDLDKFALYNPTNQLEGLKVALLAAEQGAHLLVLDGACASQNPLAPPEERIEMLNHWTSLFPKIKAAAGKSNTAILVMSLGNREKNPCGTTLKFYADRRILLEPGDVSPEIRYSVVKDKYGVADAYGRGKYTLPVMP